MYPRPKNCLKPKTWCWIWDEPFIFQAHSWITIIIFAQGGTGKISMITMMTHNLSMDQLHRKAPAIPAVHSISRAMRRELLEVPKGGEGRLKEGSVWRSSFFHVFFLSSFRVSVELKLLPFFVVLSQLACGFDKCSSVGCGFLLANLAQFLAQFWAQFLAPFWLKLSEAHHRGDYIEVVVSLDSLDPSAEPGPPGFPWVAAVILGIIFLCRILCGCSIGRPKVTA